MAKDITFFGVTLAWQSLLCDEFLISVLLKISIGDFNLGKIIVSLSDEVEKQFREEVAKRLGAKRGALSIAFEEAIKEWLKR